MTILIICISFASACLVAYSCGYQSGVMAGICAEQLGTRIDSDAPICGRTLEQIEGSEIQKDEAQ